MRASLAVLGDGSVQSYPVLPPFSQEATQSFPHVERLQDAAASKEEFL